MSAVDGPPAPLPSDEPAAPPFSRPVALPSLCPYLATLGGNWRSASVVREHRCMAVSPPVQLAPEKQRRLCLVEAHVTCATYLAALLAHPVATSRSTGPTRPIARMTPVILDQGRFDVRVPALRADRASGQAVLVGLLGVAVAAILFARPSGDGGAAPVGADASGSPPSGAVPSRALARSPSAAPAGSTPTPALTDAPSATAATPNASLPSRPSAAPSSSPTRQPATSGSTYKVKSGDTLSAIAARFGTTVRVLIDLNGIADPSKLKVGQVLKLP